MIYILSFLLMAVFIGVPVIIWLNVKDAPWRPLYTLSGVIGVIIMAQAAYTGPMYNVWQQQLTGKAELQRAEWNRQIVIEEAKAQEESSKSWAAAEVIRAKGSDEANKIMAQSLGGNANYLRWLWIEKMDKLQGQVIYLPADGGLPIMEAGRYK